MVLAKFWHGYIFFHNACVNESNFTLNSDVTISLQIVFTEMILKMIFLGVLLHLIMLDYSEKKNRKETLFGKQKPTPNENKMANATPLRVYFCKGILPSESAL